MRRMITDKLTKNIKEVVNAYQDGEIALTEDIPTKTSDLTNDSDFITANDVTQVVANPTLAGDEANLTGLQVGDAKYAIPQGGGGSATLYRHYISIDGYDASFNATCNLIVDIISTSNTAITSLDALKTILTSGTGIHQGVLASGAVKDGANVRNIIGLRVNASTLQGQYVDSSSSYVLYANVDIPTADVVDTIYTL